MRTSLLPVALTILLILSSGSASGLLGTSAMADQQAGSPSVSVSADTSGSSMVYTLEVSALEGVDRLSLVVGRNAVVTAVGGGEVVSTEGRTRIRWRGGDRFRVVVRTSQGSQAGVGSTEYFTAEDWRLGRVPYVELRWWGVGSDQVHRQRPLGDRAAHLTDTQRGVYGDRYALVGDRTEINHQANGQQFRIAAPAGTAFGADIEDVQSSLTAASRQLQVGDRDSDVLLFALPDPARRGGESVPARDEAWLNAGSAVNDPNNVWVHEYVHTRQSFQLESDMRWFREASAEYFAARLTYEQGRITRQELFEHFGGESHGQRLTTPSEWANRRVPYTKGPRVLAVLDRNIRQSTNGQQSLEDVFRRMNHHDGPVSYADFRDMVAAVAGHRMDAWLDRYVAGETAIGSVYGPPVEAGFVPQLEHVLGTTGQGVVFMAISALLSFVAAFPLYLVLNRFDPEWERRPSLRLPRWRPTDPE